MSCPFNKDSLDKLQTFIDVCKTKPEVLHLPQLSFFKSYLETLGAAIPEPPTMESAPAEPKLPTEAESEPESEESELELDLEGCIDPDDVSNHIMGDSTKVPSEEEIEKADEKRFEAMSAFGEGNYENAVELLSEAIILNPTSAVLFVKRGQSYLKLNKPNACIKDCTRALELNPDSATGYKYRGRAHRLVAEWEEAAKDLRQACIIDFDEDIDDWLKEVTPNAQKIVQHKLKQERKRVEKEQKERAERIHKAKEAHAKSAAEQQQHGNVGDAGGPAGVGDFSKLLQDPELLEAVQDPEIASAVQDIITNPANFMKYQSNPKVMAFINKLSQKKFPGFPGFGGGMGGGFPGGFPGAGGFGSGTPGFQPRCAEDDGLD
ncbi:hypothetical protein FQA39_LY13937 [Lamprigera yunnana]|nr:hypothetical protein FQA39_LY13937 [Lamprigera yunnana]